MVSAHDVDALVEDVDVDRALGLRGRRLLQPATGRDVDDLVMMRWRQVVIIVVLVILRRRLLQAIEVAHLAMLVTL